MATLQQIIAAIPVGKTNAMKVPDFEQAVGNKPSGTNNNQTRREIKSAIYDNDIPIGSSPPVGCWLIWLIDSDAECQEVVDQLSSIIQEYTRKMDAIKNGWQRRKQSKNTGNPWPK
jgi:hypothetical protein